MMQNRYHPIFTSRIGWSSHQGLEQVHGWRKERMPHSTPYQNAIKACPLPRLKFAHRLWRSRFRRHHHRNLMRISSPSITSWKAPRVINRIHITSQNGVSWTTMRFLSTSNITPDFNEDLHCIKIIWLTIDKDLYENTKMRENAEFRYECGVYCQKLSGLSGFRFGPFGGVSADVEGMLKVETWMHGSRSPSDRHEMSHTNSDDVKANPCVQDEPGCKREIWKNRLRFG